MASDGRREESKQQSTLALVQHFGETMWCRLKADQPQTLLTYMVMATGGLFALSAASILLCGLMCMAVVASWFAIFAIVVIASCLSFWAVVTAFISFIVASTLGSMTASLYVATAFVVFVQYTVLPAVHRLLVYLRGARDLPLGASRLTQPLSCLILMHCFRDSDGDQPRQQQPPLNPRQQPKASAPLTSSADAVPPAEPPAVPSTLAAAKTQTATAAHAPATYADAAATRPPPRHSQEPHSGDDADDFEHLSAVASPTESRAFDPLKLTQRSDTAMESPATHVGGASSGAVSPPPPLLQQQQQHKPRAAHVTKQLSPADQ